mgnify:CR=1 FL=1
MELVLVGLGGCLGGLSRFQLGRLLSRRAGFPIGTFVINLTGAFLLGVLTAADTSRQLYLFLGDGFLGAYTTFSTFMYEGVQLFGAQDRRNAPAYVLGSLLLGVLGYLAGFALG